MKPTVLIVDDNRSSADALVRVLTRRGYGAEARYGGADALQRLEAGGIDVVLTDLRMAPVDGFAVIAGARALPRPPEVLVFTGYGTVDGAVRALRMGARDFLTKPVTPDQLVDRLEALTGAGAALPVQIGPSATARQLAGQIAAVAVSDAPALLLGEPGSGRQQAAVQIHHLGPRSGEPFRVLPRPEALTTLESGAVYLPAVDQLDEAATRALIRALDALTGGPRVIAGAASGWRSSIDDDPTARELYYRLAVLPVHLPPLRARPEDLPALLAAILEDRARAIGRDAPTPTPAQLDRLRRHPWPGNLRELAAVAERALIFGPGAFDLPSTPNATSPSDPPSLGEGFSLSQHLEAQERTLLLLAGKQAGWDRGEMCRLLGVERNTLRYKLNKYKLLRQRA